MSLRSTHELEGIAARLIQAHGVLQCAIGDTDVEKWVRHIVRRLRAEGVAHQQWLRVALQLIHPDVKSAMKAEHEERGNRAEVSPGWSLDLTLRAYFEDTAGDGWKEFTEAVKRAHHRITTLAAAARKEQDEATVLPNAPIPVPGLTREELQATLRAVKEHAQQIRTENPALAKAGGIALMVGGGIVIVPAASAAALLAMGFGPLGPIAGTLAPFLQSVFWSAQTGGLFSVLQAAGMTAVAPSAVATGLAGAAASVGAWIGFGRRPPPGPPADASDETE